MCTQMFTRAVAYIPHRVIGIGARTAEGDDSVRSHFSVENLSARIESFDNKLLVVYEYISSEIPYLDRYKFTLLGNGISREMKGTSSMKENSSNICCSDWLTNNCDSRRTDSLNMCLED